VESAVIKSIFEKNSYDFLYQKFKYQFYVSGLFDRIDNSDVLDRFLENYSFEEDDNTLFDDFLSTLEFFIIFI
jgi:hypothetical protein